jgi:hypothetical protein
MTTLLIESAELKMKTSQEHFVSLLMLLASQIIKYRLKLLDTQSGALHRSNLTLTPELIEAFQTICFQGAFNRHEKNKEINSLFSVYKFPSQISPVSTELLLKLPVPTFEYCVYMLLDELDLILLYPLVCYHLVREHHHNIKACRFEFKLELTEHVATETAEELERTTESAEQSELAKCRAALNQIRLENRAIKLDLAKVKHNQQSVNNQRGVKSDSPSTKKKDTKTKSNGNGRGKGNIPSKAKGNPKSGKGNGKSHTQPKKKVSWKKTGRNQGSAAKGTTKGDKNKNRKSGRTSQK